MTIQEFVANQIKVGREAKGFTRAELARLAGISQMALTYLEEGRAKGDGREMLTRIDLVAVRRIAKVLGVSMDYLSGMSRDDLEGLWGACTDRAGEHAAQATTVGA